MKKLVTRTLSIITILILLASTVASQTYLNNGFEQALEINDGDIITVAGISPFTGDGDVGTNATLYSPSSIVIDSKGNLFVGDLLNFRIRRVDAHSGVITTIAGNGSPLFSGDGGKAINAGIIVSDMAIDSMDNLFVADSSNNRIRKIDSITGIITTVAGGGTMFDGDNLDATQIRFSSPSGVAVDTKGNIFISDTRRSRVCRVDSVTGKVATIAGNNFGLGGDGGLAIDANFRFPTGISVDAQGNILIADPLNNRIRRIDGKTQIITSLLISSFRPQAAIADTKGNIYVAETGNSRIRLIKPTGEVSTFAGSDSNPFGGFSGDSGLATNAMLSVPIGLALDPSGALLVVDNGNDRIRKIDLTSNIITTIIGKSRFGFSGDGGVATKAMLGGPEGLVTDKNGVIFIVDTLNNRIRKIDKDGVISTIVGNGKNEFSGDSGLALEAGLNFPSAVALDSGGNLFIADMFNSRIRKVDVNSKIITTVAGNGKTPFNVDVALATDASLPFPTSLAIDSKNNILILSAGRICKVDASGKITRIAGNENQDFAGDNGLAINATFNVPNSITIDKSDNIFVADSFNHRVRRIDAITSIVTTVAGNGSPNFGSDGSPATNTGISSPDHVVIDSKNNLIIGENGSARIRKVDNNTKIVSTIAGNGFLGASGDGAAATKASITGFAGLAIDSSDNLYFSDFSSNIVRMVKSLSQK